MFIMEEKRQEPRFGVSFPVECVMQPERKKIFYTVSRDLSHNGAKILHEDFVKKGKDLKVNINLIDEIAEVKAKVMWCTKAAQTNRYYVGLKFLGMSSRHKQALNYFINRINNS